MAKPKGVAFEARFELRLNRLFDRVVHEGAKSGIAKGLQAMTRAAMRGSPYDTGHNARNIGWTTNFGRSGGGGGDKGRSIDLPDGKHAGAIFTGSGYGGYLEVGARGRGGRPYIRPAVEQEAAYLLQSIRDEIKARS